MLNSQQVTADNLLPLFATTFQGSSTQQINDAYFKLLQAAKNHSNPFINACQKILQTQSNDRHICQSVSNFIKCMTKHMIDSGLVKEHGPKDFINKIQHTFDNSKIATQYKENIAFSYIKAALHFRQSFQKIIGRISYLYKTKQSQQAVLLARAYLSCDSRLDSKSQNFYYNKILPLQLKYLHDQIISFRKLLSEGNSNHFQKAQVQLRNIHEVLKNIHSALVFIAFEKFESSIFACLQNKEIVEIINSMQIFKKNDQIIIILREIIQKVTQSLFRMRRMQKIPALMQALSYQLHQEWKQFQQTLLNKNSFIHKGIYSSKGLELEQEISKIKLLTAALDSRIILILDDKFDILNVLVHPLFEIRTQLFQKDQQDVKQVFLLFEDACFSMKSQCLEVEFNRLVKSLLTNYEVVSSKVHFTLDELLFNNKNFEEFVHNQQNTVVMLLSLIAFQTSYFMTNDNLLSKLESFLKRYQGLLFNKDNAELYFHSLLILCNYLDDIFCEDFDAQIFQIITQNFIENKLKINQGNFDSQVNLITQFEKTILKSFYTAGFTEKEVSKESSIIIQFLSQNFDDQGISIYIELMKNYKIEDRITLQVFDRMLEFLTDMISNNKVNQSASHQKINAFIKFLEVFFDLDIYKHLFESTLSRILPIFQVLISNADLFMDQFFNLIINAIKHLEYVPQNYFTWMGNLFSSQKLQSELSFRSLVTVLKYASPSRQNNDLKYEIFVNCIALHLIETIVKSIQELDKNNQPTNMFDTFSQLSFSQQSSIKSQRQKQFYSLKHKEDYSKRQLLALLSLHQLIYYHSGYFAHRTLLQIVQLSASQIVLPQLERNRRNQQPQRRGYNFSFVRGKYQLLFVLLFRRRLTDVNQILFQLGLQKKVYDAVYMRDNQYLIEYDTPILIKQQTQILKKFISHDKLQMAYANTSFLAIFYKFYIIFEIKNKDRRKKIGYVDFQSSDSDEEEFQTVSEFKSNFKQVVKLIESFPLPQQWTQINELKQIKQFIQMLRSNESTREWLHILVQHCMTKQQVRVMEDLMKDLQNVNGKYRHIVKVNKNSPGQASKQNPQRDVDI